MYQSIPELSIVRIMLFVTMLEVSYLNYRNWLPEVPLYLLYLNFLNADSYFQILLYFKLSELFSQFPGLFLTNLKLNSNQFQANACFLKALKISEKLIFFIPYKRNIYLKWVDKLSQSVKFTSNFLTSRFLSSQQIWQVLFYIGLRDLHYQGCAVVDGSSLVAAAFTTDELIV